MKTLARIIVIAAGVAVAVPVTNAADSVATAAKHPRLRALMLRKAVRERAAQKLNLTAEQTAQLKSARAQAVKSIKAVRADHSLTREQKKAQIQAAIQSARAAARSTLNADQLKKLQRFREHLRARLSRTV